MKDHIEERRLKGIAKQIGFLKSEIRAANRKGLKRFLLGLALGLSANILTHLFSVFP